MSEVLIEGWLVGEQCPHSGGNKMWIYARGEARKAVACCREVRPSLQRNKSIRHSTPQP
jgi:hypothetical protein